MRFLKITFYFFVFMMSSCQSNSQTYTIETTLGNIRVRLYDKTPLHKENFEKLVKGQFYDGVSFHRVIAEFMIQAGDGATKPVPEGEASRGDLDYTVPAEFAPEYIHKKGALAAARTGDAVNPEKRSSPSQFYIVQGRIYNDDELNQIEEYYGKMFSREQRIIYKTVGGAPFLDRDYTVFGEVVSGLEIVDAIAAVPTGFGDVPIQDVRILRIVKN